MEYYVKVGVKTGLEGINIADFINRNAHWLLLLIVGISIPVGFTVFTSSVQGIIAGVFGVIGFLGVMYLVIHVEVAKRKRKQIK